MKFLLGVSVGLAVGMLALAGTVGGFVAGLVWGRDLFSESQRHPKSYRYSHADPPPTRSEEEIPTT